MDREFVKQWIADLRYGGFKQTRGVLYNPQDESFCCLGVACKRIAEKTGETIKRVAVPEEYNQMIETIKSPAILKMLGLSDSPGDWIDVDNHITKLTTMNDSGSKFLEIADHIEKHILKE